MQLSIKLSVNYCTIKGNVDAKIAELLTSSEFLKYFHIVWHLQACGWELNLNIFAFA